MISIKRILCPIDLASNTDQALAYALALSQAHDAKLILLYCSQAEGVSAAAMGISSSMGSTQVSLAMTVAQMKASLGNAIARVLGPQLGPQFNWEAVVVEGGDPGECITQAAGDLGVDLIVMRSRRRPHRAAVLGSTAEAVCRTAPCPVFVTHADEREWLESSDGNITIERLLVAYDFSDYAELALGYGLSLAQEHQAELHLLHVLPPGSVSEPEIAWHSEVKETAYHQAARRLQRMIPPEVYLWCQIKHAVSEGQPYREILNYAEKNAIDLISLGAHGANFGMRTLFGSNVDRVLRQAPCPVLVARPRKPA
jgi:nucleotide-binding universal stress UspA family protein